MLHLVQSLVTDETDGLCGFRQMNSDEVGLNEQFLECHHLDAELRSTCRLHIGVVGNELDAERRKTLRDEHADAAETDDAVGKAAQTPRGHVVHVRPAAFEVLAQCRVERGGAARDRVNSGLEV